MDTIFRAIVGYFFLVLIVRVLARRPGAQMALFEFVIIFLIGGVAILSTVGNDRSVTNCTCAVIAVCLMHRIVSWAKARFPRIGAIVDGTPLVIYNNGDWKPEAIKHANINVPEVEAAARSKGIASFDQIAYAILERNGSISIIRKDS
jgi:uncharacterized membrane protein YcaP (DUF421 family)